MQILFEQKSITRNKMSNGYPGLGLPIRYFPQLDHRHNPPPTFPLGSHPDIPGSNSDLLPVREVAMMAIMDRLTDKPEWYRKVFDEAILSKWKEEALAVPDEEWMKIAAAPKSEWDEPLPRRIWENDTFREVPTVPSKVVGIMSEKAFDYCVQELRDKAIHYEKTGLIPTIDASATVVKSDVLVKTDLRDALKEAFEKLQDDQKDEPDWHPNSGDMVQDLIHPSMYPLVYGRSRVLKDEVVTVTDAVEKWAGKGEIISEVEDSVQEDEYSVQEDGFALWQRPAASQGSSDIPTNYWSTSYQWLPSNVSLLDDGTVKLTSYINNLHPRRYPDIYATVEKLIETAIPAWDQCLVEYRLYERYGPGRKVSRFSLPKGVDDEIAENWSPSDPAELAGTEVDLSNDYRFNDIETEEDEKDLKWKILRTPVLREPGSFKKVNYELQGNKEDAESSSGSLGGLRQNFKDFGLQIIVKMASIELTPEKPEFPAGGWHIEGLLNEKICATALYYLDSENVTDSSLSFRMHTSYEQDELQNDVGQDSYHWLECNYGTNLAGFNGSCIQNYGSVNTPEGRLLAFPNVFQHRVSPFELVDKTKPGHRRFIALWLVDPHQRIISTANVPPQQQDWWADSIFGASTNEQKAAAEKLPAEMVQLLREKGVELPNGDEKGAIVPNEVLELVRKEFNLGLLSTQEAKEHRLALMAERTSHQVDAEKQWLDASYSFCEH